MNFSVPEYKKIIIEASDGYRYYSDLSSLSKVYCFPKNLIDWSKISIDPMGLGLIWENRFEVHIDQIIGLSEKSEKILKFQTG